MNRDTRTVRIVNPEQDRQPLEQAAQILRQGGLVVFPTETVYGLGANALDTDAVAGIFEAKGRPQDNPLIVHIADLEELEPLVRIIPPEAKLLAEAFWPGPLTMILPKSDRVPAAISAGLDTVAVRMPSGAIARELIRLSGVPVAAPSANLSGRPSPTEAAHCVEDLAGRVDMILDGGACLVGVESTVVSLCGKMPRLLRPGAVTVSQLESVLGVLEIDPAVTRHIDDGEAVASPGMKYKHYAPKARVILVEGTIGQLARFLEENRREGTWALVFDEDMGSLPVPALAYGPRGDSAAQARNLFSALRRLDELGAVTVYARKPEMDGVGLAVGNRLCRAAGFSEITLS